MRPINNTITTHPRNNPVIIPAFFGQKQSTHHPTAAHPKINPNMHTKTMQMQTVSFPQLSHCLSSHDRVRFLSIVHRSSISILYFFIKAPKRSLGASGLRSGPLNYREYTT